MWSLVTLIVNRKVTAFLYIIMNIIMHHNEYNVRGMGFRLQKQTLHKLKVFGTLLPFQHSENIIIHVNEESNVPSGQGIRAGSPRLCSSSLA